MEKKRIFWFHYVFVCSSYLCDVTLKSEDGKEFPCHKSVLCARQGELLRPIYKVKNG